MKFLCTSSKILTAVEQDLSTLREENKTLKQQNEDILKDMKSIIKSNDELQNRFEEMRLAVLTNENGSTVSGSFSMSQGEALEKEQDQQTNNNDDRKENKLTPQDPFSDGISSCFFNSLDDNTVHHILLFTGKKSYATYGLLNKRCNQIFTTYNYPKDSYLFGFAPLSVIQRRYTASGNFRDGVGDGVVRYNRKDVLQWSLEEQHKLRLYHICLEASRDGRLDILNTIFEKSNEETMEYFREYDWPCLKAAENGRLDVLKLLRKNGFDWDEETFFVAKVNGHNEVLQYLRENGCPEPSDGDY